MCRSYYSFKPVMSVPPCPQRLDFLIYPPIFHKNAICQDRLSKSFVLALESHH